MGWIMSWKTDKNTVFRIGDGRSASGKILDRDTHWYRVYMKQYAIDYYNKTGKNIYVSVNNQKYRQITIDELINWSV